MENSGQVRDSTLQLSGPRPVSKSCVLCNTTTYPKDLNLALGSSIPLNLVSSILQAYPGLTIPTVSQPLDFMRQQLIVRLINATRARVCK